MIGALWTGISGLSSHQKALDNEATNIANVNTVGYKASRISFADQMYQDKIGKGSKVLDAEKLYTQGNLKVTGVSFDMALSGQGFFTVSDTRSSGSSETYYTRAGNFRMGEDGTLQDAAGNKVQGWAMADVDSDTDVKTTNPNITYFTNDYSKLAASKIIRHNNKIETITAKMTDYTQTAVADSTAIFSGAGLKTKSGKISDVEALISEYNTKLTAYQSNPAATSSPSTAQVSYVRFSLDGTAKGDGDQMYVYINGTKYSQSFDTDYATTMKKLADQISAIPGFKAYTAAGNGGSIVETTDNTALNTAGTGGALKIESLIPGKIFTVGEVAETSGVTTSVGSVVSTQGTAAVVGTGFGAVKSAQEALLMAVSGTQKDVYTVSDLTGTTTSPFPATDFTYRISMYDPDLKANKYIPSDGPLEITGATSINDIITAINNMSSGTEGNRLGDYVEAKNINGTLVVQAKQEYAGYKINGTMGSEYSVEDQTVPFGALSAGQQLTINGLTLTAGANLTAAQVAQAFATQSIATSSGLLTGAYDTWSVKTGTYTTGDTSVTFVAREGAVPAAEIDTSAVTAPSISASTTDGGATVTESHEVTFTDLLDGETVTVAGVTLTASGGTILAADVATAFENPSVNPTNGSFNPTAFVNWVAGTASGATLEFTSTTADENVPDIVVSGNASITSSTQGFDGIEEAVVTIPSLSYGQSITIAGVTYTNNNSATMTAAQVAAAVAGLSYTDWTATNNLNGTVTFKSTSGAGDQTNISVSGLSVSPSTEPTATTSAAYEESLTREKNSAYSGFTGASAEFLQMINTVDQTASQNSLQLRLDILNISDSAFGEFSVDSSGLITMKQDGAEFAIGQVAIALFNNERGLVPIGDNLVKKSNESGEPIFNVNNDKTAKIEAKTLELSTADLSESLVNLMVFQRAFEANAKSITTSDELLNTLINLKR